MGTKTGSISGVYQWPASLGITLGTGEYPSGTITFKDEPSWKENNGKTSTFTLYLCDSAGNNRVALSPTLYIYGSSRVYTTDFTIGSGGTALAGKQIYLTVARDGEIISSGFAHQNASTVTMGTANQTWTLTTAVSPSGYGSVTAGGAMTYNSTKSLTATPGTGRYFSSWSKTAGTLSSTTTNPTTFTMGTSAATVTANFGTNNYTLTVSKGTGISSATGGGSKAYGSSNNISATAATGYTFKNWTSNNGGTFGNANSASTTFTMPAGNTTVTANATVNSYTLTVAKGTGGSSVTGGGTVNFGSSNNISATAATGYTFKNWTSNNGGTFGNANSASTTFTMPAGNTTVTANFTINSYTLTTAASPTAGGTVTAGGSMNYNATKSLTATANTGYSFSSWSKTAGTLSSTTTNPTTFTMGAGNATVTANFTHIQRTLTLAVSPSGGGTTTGGGTKYYNDSCSISATAATGYSFKNWTTSSGGTIANANAASTTYTMPNGNATVTANFTHIQYTLTTASSPSEGGTTTGGGTKYYNDSCSISATAATGYTFSKWTTTGGTLANVNAASTTLTMPNGNATVTANFIHNEYTLLVTASPSGGGTTTGSGTKYYNDSCSISATTSTGYRFIGWTTSSGGTIADASSASTTYTMPNGAATVVANFEKIEYTITTSVDPEGSGTITVSPSPATYGDTITLTQAPIGSHAFDGYTSVPSLVITDGQFTMPAENVSITGHYHVTKSTCTLDSASYTGGDTATLTIQIASSSFTHRYKLDFGNGIDTGWVTLEAGIDTENIYIPVAWCLRTGGETIINNGSLTLETYDGDSLLGAHIIDNLSYYVLDGTIPELRVWRTDSAQNRNIIGEYVGYSAVVPESMSSYTVTHENTPLSIASSHNVTLNMVYGNEAFSIVRDIPKVTLGRKRIVAI